jgi:hypothetical protein
MKHFLQRNPNNRYGFQEGQELEWFEYLYNYEQSLRYACNTYRAKRYEHDYYMEQYLNMKVELRHIRQFLQTTLCNATYRPWHKAFLKSTKIDAHFKSLFKKNLLKVYEESEKKDAKYYLSIIKA